MTYEIGDSVRLSVTFTDVVSGALVNPTAVALTLRLPDGTSANTLLVNPATGQYHADYLTTQPGVHAYRWAGTGAHAAASEGNFVVSRSQFDV